MARKRVVSTVALAALALTGTACASGSVPGARSAVGAINGEANAAGRAGDTVKVPGAAGLSADAADSAVSTRVPAGMVTTMEQARKVYDFYVIRTARALAAHERSSALGQTQGVARHELTTALAQAQFDHTKAEPYKYGDPTFYIPTLSAYPDWFVAVVKRTAPPNAPTSLAGVPQAATGQELLLFQKATPGRNWQLSGDVQLLPGQSPQIAATNAHGGAEAEPINDQTQYLARPDVLGPLQASVVDDGPQAPAATVVAGGPFTTGLYQEEAATSGGPPNTGQWSLQMEHSSRVALRTTDGGVLVIYPAYLDSTITGAALTVPPQFLPLLPAGATAKPLDKVNIQYMMTFAALDPPVSAKNAKIQVIGMGGAPSWAAPAVEAP